MNSAKPSISTAVSQGLIWVCFVLFLAVPGQPSKFKVGKVTDTSIELTWEPVHNKEKIVNYELLYKPVKFGSLVRPLSLFFLINPPAEWISYQDKGLKGR